MHRSSVQMEADLLQLLSHLRTGPCARSSTPQEQVAETLDGIGDALTNLSSHFSQCSTWATLLAHADVGKVGS